MGGPDWCARAILYELLYPANSNNIPQFSVGPKTQFLRPHAVNLNPKAVNENL